jgi:transcriptional regulator with XRE-family HTH domain
MSTIDFDIVREMMRSRRERRGMTFSDVAEATGVPRSTVANFMLGLTDAPKAAALDRFLAWLDMPAERFIATDAGKATVAKVEDALLHDPTLSPDDARQLGDMMKAAYQAVTHQPAEGTR